MRNSDAGLRFLVVAALLAGPLAHAQSGLRLGERSEAAAMAPHWQARFGLSTFSGAAPDDSGRWQTSAGRLLGDYYWSGLRPARFGLNGGFRATSGVLVGDRSLALGTPAETVPLRAGSSLRSAAAPRFGDSAPQAWSAVPYVGIGYSGVSLRGGWGFTADLGLAGTSGGLRARREGAASAQGVDELLRELRLTPVLQVGASYAF